MSYEGNLLIDIAKNNLDLQVDYEMVNWSKLLELAISHKVASLLYPFFENSTQIPFYIKEIMRYIYYSQKRIIESRLVEYYSILDLFYRNSLELIVLKGVYLSSVIYSAPSQRLFFDLDILAKYKELEQAQTLLRNAGYQQGIYRHDIQSIMPFDKQSIQKYETKLQHLGEYIRISEEPLCKYYSIDLHHKMGTEWDSYYFDVDTLIARKQQFTYKDSIGYSLCNEDMLIHLCYHNFWHTQSLENIKKRSDMLLRNYMDIRLFIKKVQIDWTLLNKILSASNMLSQVHYSLYFCHKIFGDVLNQDILDQMDIEALNSESRNIYDRWITLDSSIVVGTYADDFLDRLFDTSRYDKALFAFRNSGYRKYVIENKEVDMEYINKLGLRIE